MTRVSATAFWLSLTIVVSLGLYHTSYQVENMGRSLRGLNAQIQTEQRALHILRAEWNYLASPARIEEVAQRHLDLKPTNPSQIADIKRLASVLPTQRELLAQRNAAPRALAATRTTRPVATTPKIAASEENRLNQKVIFESRSHQKTITDSALPRWQNTRPLTLADTSVIQ